MNHKSPTDVGLNHQQYIQFDPFFWFQYHQKLDLQKPEASQFGSEVDIFPMYIYITCDFWLLDDLDVFVAPSKVGFRYFRI